jgi:soluble epoxide hydrolase/lipid-phosphate phosphatase
MENLEKKTFKTSRGLNYTYYITPNADSSKPTVLLQHGWPDDAHLWAKVIPYLQKTGYPLLIPDLLGYAGTDKPSDAALYNSRDISKDLIEIADHEGIRSIVSAGHDWGSYLASRVPLYFPDRVVGVILLNVAYIPPTDQPFDLDQMNATMQEMFHHPIYAYWELFAAPDGPKVLGEHTESLYTVLHGDEEDWMIKMFSTRGAMREYLLQDKTVPLKKYAQDPGLRETWLKRMQRDGFEGPQNWYCCMVQGYQFNVEKEIPKENYVIKVPLLYLACTKDTVCRPEVMEIAKQYGLVPTLETKVIECAHWCTFEAPEQVGPAMAEWLERQNLRA